MGILDNLLPPIKIVPCRVRTLTNNFEPKDQVIFTEAINSPFWKAEPLARALQSRNISVSGSAISRHRLGQCSCSKMAN